MHTRTHTATEKACNEVDGLTLYSSGPIHDHPRQTHDTNQPTFVSRNFDRSTVCGVSDLMAGHPLSWKETQWCTASEPAHSLGSVHLWSVRQWSVDTLNSHNGNNVTSVCGTCSGSRRGH